MRHPLWLLLATISSLAACANEPVRPTASGYATVEGALGSAGVVVNEFRPGKAGWVELYNPGSKAADISNFVLMNFGYNAMPKGYVVPTPTSIPAKGRLVVPLVIRSTVADGVKLLDHGGLYGAADNLQDVTGQYKLPSGSPLCFARQPDGGGWLGKPVPCTKNTANPAPSGCSAGAPCSDGDPCTQGEVWTASCQCSGGKPKVCDDGNVCTDDSCAAGVCQFKAGYVKTPCGTGKVCQLGTCVSSSGSGGACIDPGGTIDGVKLTAAQACQAVAFMNGAKYSELEAMSDTARQVIYDGGPNGYANPAYPGGFSYHPAAWQSVSQFAAVNLIGKTAVQLLLDLSSKWQSDGLWYDTVQGAYKSKATGTHFTFEKVWVSKVVNDTCYEIRDGAQTSYYLQACSSYCYSGDACNYQKAPPAGQFVWVRGRLEYSAGKWMVQAAQWRAANPKL